MKARLFLVVFGILGSAACVAQRDDDAARRGASTQGQGEGQGDGGSGPTHPPCVSATTIANTIGGDYVIPRDIDERGGVIGSADVGGGVARAFSWRDGVLTDLGTLGGSGSDALATNDRGEVVGYSALPGGTTPTRAVLWKDGAIVDLGTLGGDFSIAGDIDNAGRIVGNSLTSSGETHAFVWEGGTMTDLGTLGGSFSTALRINDRGQILGRSRTAGDAAVHAVLWEDGEMTDLGPYVPELNARGQILLAASPEAYLWERGSRTTIVPFGDAMSTSAFGLNDRGQVIGAVARPTGPTTFLWDDGRTTEVGAGLTLLALNNHAEVVGYAGTGADPRAFVWKDGTLTFLSGPGERTVALTLNDRGQILGTAAPGLAVVWEARACGASDAGGGPDAGAGDDGGGPGKTW